MTAGPFLLKASSIGATAAHRVAHEGETGRVHSVFPGVINVVTPEGHLVSVVDSRVGKGPINILTHPRKSSSMISMDIRKDDVVWKADGALVVGKAGLGISMGDASVYTPKKRFGGALLSASEIEYNLTGLRQYASSHGRFEGTGQLMRPLLGSSPHGLEARELNPFARAALPHFSNLITAIRERNYPTIRRTAANLIGLGPGLTPSADDTLAGLMVSLRLMVENGMIDPNHIARVIGEITPCIPGRTTLLSEEYLMHAAIGEANEPVMRLVQRTLTAGPEEVREATGRLLMVGESSGTDIVFGILLGCKLALGDPSAWGADS